MLDSSKTSYSKFRSAKLKALNSVLLTGFQQHEESPDIKRSHLFNGRYENVYLDEAHIPDLKTLRQEALHFASQLLNTDDIQVGIWFNHMPPGSVTLAHRHDDDDELLSAVYYVSVPPNSGNLLIHDRGETFEITPEEGMFVFFKPDVMHEVTENHSQQDRLSIGMNFGVKKST